MKINWKLIAISELVILVVVSGALFWSKRPANTISTGHYALISPRVNAGIIEPKSFLIVNYAPLKDSIESFIEKNSLNISVYIGSLRDGVSIGINERKGYPPGSFDKVHNAMLIMKKVERGELSLDTLMPINDSMRSSAYGSLYKTNAKELPLGVLMEKMLKESDDTAFKIIASNVDLSDKSFLLSYLDYYSTDSTSNNFPGEDRQLGLVTPKSMYNVFSSLYLSTVLETEHSEYILSLLTDTVFDINRIAELPENVTVAQKFALKYANQDRYLHSCGILYIDKSRIFYCVMTEGLNQKTAEAVIGAIVNSIYKYNQDTKSELNKLKKVYNFD